MMRAALALLVLSLAGCSTYESPDRLEAEVEITHVHGIGYLPATNEVFLATHHGLIKGTEAQGRWAWSYVGMERFDYMGFVQDAVDPTTFYSSGHPDDPRAYGGVHLGLRRSTDGGVTWEQRSLKGMVDFHSLSNIPNATGAVVGLNGDKLMESRDGGLTWTNHTVPLTHLPFDVAVTDHHAYITSADGLLAGHIGNTSSWSRHGAEHTMHPQFYSIAAAPDGSILFAGTGNGRSGTTYQSLDEGHHWTQVAEPLLREAAVPVHFAFDHGDPSHILAATGGGSILESRDSGVSWVQLR